jgi:hypothetical protein
MKNVRTFVTLSPLPGFSNWLIAKLHLQDKFKEEHLLTEQEKVSTVLQMLTIEETL